MGITVSWSSQATIQRVNIDSPDINVTLTKGNNASIYLLNLLLS
jgi:hypothetical protein